MHNYGLESRYADAVDVLRDLLDYADRHRVSHGKDSGCGCDGQCYEVWSITKHEAERVINAY